MPKDGFVQIIGTMQKMGYDEIALASQAKRIKEWFDTNYGSKKVELNAASIIKEFERTNQIPDRVRDYQLITLVRVMKASGKRIWYQGLKSVLEYSPSERGYPFPDALKAEL